ncbi:S-adenosyl-L-methionine-dependent methyltransferase [Endogone sp. FLAS-F59071]|nr:S-adenosyl-L-methionine-dependent methyltransferase [Endogone sp. FLAS-F59071]|eukprot:RUS19723.1 S-adenosyl-L-methionine-dependent methyltransferase [Endogone sp. FLAS-F59071]
MQYCTLSDTIYVAIFPGETSFEVLKKMPTVDLLAKDGKDESDEETVLKLYAIPQVSAHSLKLAQVPHQEVYKPDAITEGEVREVNTRQYLASSPPPLLPSSAFEPDADGGHTTGWPTKLPGGLASLNQKIFPRRFKGSEAASVTSISRRFTILSTVDSSNPAGVEKHRHHPRPGLFSYKSALRMAQPWQKQQPDPTSSLLSKFKHSRKSSNSSISSSGSSQASAQTAPVGAVRSHSESVLSLVSATRLRPASVLGPSPMPTLSAPRAYSGGKHYYEQEWKGAAEAGQLEETSRSLMERHMIPKMSFDGLVTSRFVAPIENVLRSGASVLDVGCGSSSWIMELAATYPASHFVGTDISLALLAHTPSNCSFQLVNGLEFPLPFADGSFDFVRHYFGLTITENKWPELVKELTRILKPGGWLELAESDMWLRRGGPTCQRINQIVRSLLRLKGLDPLASRSLTTLLQDETDLVCVSGSSFSNPVGWGGLQGAHARGSLMGFLDDLGPLVSIEKDVWNELVEAAKRELDEEEASGRRCLLSWWVAYGRKPE